MVRKSPRRKKNVNRMTFDSDGNTISIASSASRKKKTQTKKRGRSKTPSRGSSKTNAGTPNLQRMWTHTLGSGRKEERIHRSDIDEKISEDSVPILQRMWTHTFTSSGRKELRVHRRRQDTKIDSDDEEENENISIRKIE